jgi:hypothetical protein
MRSYQYDSHFYSKNCIHLILDMDIELNLPCGRNAHCLGTGPHAIRSLVFYGSLSDGRVLDPAHITDQ